MTCNANPLTSQRNLMNIRQDFFYTYAMINHFKFTDGGLLPNTAYTSVYGQMINSQGWPIDPAIIGKGFNGGGIRVPNTDDYTGTYTIDPGPTGIGDANFTFNLGVWTIDAVNSVNVTQVGGAGSGHFTTTTNGSPWKLVVTLSGLNTTVNLIALNFTGVSTTYLTDFRFYRTGDAARLAAGKLFRLPFLQAIVDMNPSAVRFMDWLGGNDDQNCRWENRCHPDHGVYTNDYFASPPYGQADYVSAAGSYQQYTLAASAGTAGNPKTTPVAMTHGEVCVAELKTGLVRGGYATVTAITRAATPTVTAVAHPFISGDMVYHQIPTASGMQQLDRRVCQVTVVDADHYTININTSGFAAFSGTANAQFYVSLNVGLRGDFVILATDGFTPPTALNGPTTGPGYMQAPSLFTFWFDKNISPINNSSGTPIPGAWMMSNADGNVFGPGPQRGMPVELCTQLILEANELSVSQGINNPIHQYMCLPFRGMLSMDPDYTSGSNFATNMVDAVLNGTTVNGVTYAGLKSVNGPSLLLEHSNETWNGGHADTQGIFLRACGQAIAGKDNYNEAAGYSMLRSVQMVKDVKAAFPGETRIKFVMASQGTNTGVAFAYIDGSAFYNANKQAGWGTPIAEHDAFAIAPYLDPFSGGNFTTPYNLNVWEDNAKYLGADNSGALRLTANASTSKQIVTTAITNGPVVVGQTIFGEGIPDDTFVNNVAGSSPNYTLTLNNTVNTPAGALLSSLIVMTASAVSASATMNITAANAHINATSLPSQLVGTGATPGNLFVIGVSGTFPNYVLTLSGPITFAGGTVSLHHPVGGNYIGAANQAAALQHFVDVVRGVTVSPVETNIEIINRYCDPSNPSAGLEAGYVAHTGFGSAGKVLIHYEGGTNWGSTAHPLNPVADNAGLFLIAVNQSVQWATATTNYFDARATQAHMGMPAIYGWISGSENSSYYFWSYAAPDNYASHIEGQNLKNTAFWPALGARNQAFIECPAATLLTFGFSVIHGHAKRHTKMIGY